LRVYEYFVIHNMLKLVKKPSYFCTMRFFLTRIGAYLSQKQIGKVNSALNYLEAGRWMHAKRFKPQRFSNRTQLHEFVGHPFIDKRVCYLEFGVSEGYSLQQWGARLVNPVTQ